MQRQMIALAYPSDSTQREAVLTHWSCYLQSGIWPDESLRQIPSDGCHRQLELDLWYDPETKQQSSKLTDMSQVTGIPLRHCLWPRGIVHRVPPARPNSQFRILL
jgi:hypothetical protein